MIQKYLSQLLYATLSIVRLRINQTSTRYLLLALLSRFMGARSLNDLAQLFGIPKNRLYGSLRHRNAIAYQAALARKGQERLFRHLKKLERASPATRSREQVILATDDSTEETRGFMAGLAGNFYNGALGKVTSGLNLQALCATIGDTGETILLAVRLVLPAPEEGGRRPMKRSEWFIKRMAELEEQARRSGTSLRGCIVSVDSAYASKAVKETLDQLALPLVTKLASSRKVAGFLVPGYFWETTASAFLKFWFFLHEERLRPMMGEDGVEYLRIVLKTRVYGEILVIGRRTPGEVKFLVSTDPLMKAKTVHRAAVRRWRLERFFWSLKQDLGLGDIHNQKSEVIMARLVLLCVLYQATLDTARKFSITPSQLIRALRRHPRITLHAILSGSAFSDYLDRRAVLDDRLAA
jgi:hypothetical protein